MRCATKNCPTSADRDEDGLLPYANLRVLEDMKKKGLGYRAKARPPDSSGKNDGVGKKTNLILDPQIIRLRALMFQNNTIYGYK